MQQEILIQQQPAVLQDLNTIPIPEGSQEVLIFPPQAAVAQQINDLDWEHINNEVEMETVQQAPLQHVDPPQQLNVDPLQQLPINLGNIDNFLHHE